MAPLAIEGWTKQPRPWFFLGEELGTLQSALMGARSNEVVVTGSITTNLHALLATFYQPSGQRTRIIADELDFPSDLYALQSHLRMRGLDPAEHLLLVSSRDGRTIDEQDFVSALQRDDVALAWVPSVLYRSGQAVPASLNGAAATWRWSTHTRQTSPARSRAAAS